jgi:hypothetical protein
MCPPRSGRGATGEGPRSDAARQSTGGHNFDTRLSCADARSSVTFSGMGEDEGKPRGVPLDDIGDPAHPTVLQAAMLAPPLSPEDAALVRAWLPVRLPPAEAPAMQSAA